MTELHDVFQVRFTSDDVVELTEFDRRLFAGYHTVSGDFYARLFDDGAEVIGHCTRQGKVVSIASLFLNRMSDPGLPQLERRLPDWAGFLDGDAVDPAYREHGLHKLLIERRIARAQELGKAGIITIVRPDNMPSARNMHHNGLYGVADGPGYYGDRPQDDRIIYLGLFDHPNVFSRDGQELGRDSRHVQLSVHDGFGETNPALKLQIGEFLSNGFVSYACMDDGARDPDIIRGCAAFLAPLEALPIDSAAISDLQAARRDVMECL